MTEIRWHGPPLEMGVLPGEMKRMLKDTCPPRPTAANAPRRRAPRILLALTSLLLFTGCATGTVLEVGGGSSAETGGGPPCAEQTLPSGWPKAASDDATLLVPFLICASPGEFLALQQRVDMPALVARLKPWSAVRLGALGPLREEAASPLNRQRARFLLESLEDYGAAHTEVLAHFVLDSSHDDDLREVLFVLAQDKRLVELLEQLPSLGPALEARGLKPSAHAERDLQWSDVGRGLAAAGQDALATSPMVNGARSTLMRLRALEAQLPPPYQQALAGVERGLLERQFSAGHVTLGVVDHLTFGVPLGFYGLMVSTGHGAYALTQGRYEQAVRELTPAALMVALYTGGRAAAVPEGPGVTGIGTRGWGGLEGMDSRVGRLLDTARQARGLWGEQGLQELAGYIRARREAGRLVAVGGLDAAVALHEARGDVAQAQAMMSRARPESLQASVGTRGPRASLLEYPDSLASLVDEPAGLTRDVVEARLAAAESDSTGPRLSTQVAVLERQRPCLETAPPEAQGNPRWGEYVTYYEGRLKELKEGGSSKGPLVWDAYEQLRGWFSRGLAFERVMVRVLKADASLPRAERGLLKDFDRPRIETNVGVNKPGPGLRYADVLVIEEGETGGGPRRVETFSFKSRDLSGLERSGLVTQLLEDAREAVRKYGETLEVRRDSLQHFFAGGKVWIARVRLIYEGGKLKPINPEAMRVAQGAAQSKVPEVEISVQ